MRINSSLPRMKQGKNFREVLPDPKKPHHIAQKEWDAAIADIFTNPTKTNDQQTVTIPENDQVQQNDISQMGKQ